MLKIGITGGIGSGKTTVCKVFEILGIPAFYADEAAKDVMHNDGLLVSGIKNAFGDESYSGNTLNRKYLADIVFNDEHKLEELNKLVHPAVFRAFDTWLIEQVNAPYIIKEAALLFESGSYRLCDKNILVTAPVELKIRRTIERDNITADEVRARMNKQFTEDQSRQLADFMIINDEQMLVLPQVLGLHKKFLSLAL